MSRSETKRSSLPTATVTDYRSPLWLVGRHLPGPRQHETAWGHVMVERGNPSSIHRDILDGIFCAALQVAETPAGEMHILFDARAVLKLLGTRADSRWLRQRLIDLMQTVIKTKSAQDAEWPPSYTLLTFVGDSFRDADRPEWQFGGKLKKIVLSPGAVQAMANDIQIFLNNTVVSRLLSLRHAISRSVARWLMSHKGSQTHDINDLIDVVGACHVRDRQRRAYTAQLRADAEGMRHLGIRINGKKVTYRRPPEGVWFQMPVT